MSGGTFKPLSQNRKTHKETPLSLGGLVQPGGVFAGSAATRPILLGNVSMQYSLSWGVNAVEKPVQEKRKKRCAPEKGGCIWTWKNGRECVVKYWWSSVGGEVFSRSRDAIHTEYYAAGAAFFSA